MNTQDFNNLDKATQRVLVAKDALALLKADVYEPTHSCFTYIGLSKTPKEGTSFQRALKRSNIDECSVCALGALMLSTVRKKNNVMYDPFYSDNPEYGDFSKVFKSLFSKKQRIKIENAYELGSGYYASVLADGFDSKSVAFGQRYPNSKDRLAAILKNIIVNNGTFKP